MLILRAFDRTAVGVPPLLRMKPLLCPSNVCKRMSASDSASNPGKTPFPDSPGNLPLMWLFFLASAGIAFYAGYLLNRGYPHLVDYDTFLKLLERGEVEGIVLNHHSPYAFVSLHSVYPGTDKKVVVVPLLQSPENLEKNVREKEKLWGIPQDDQLPIRYGTRRDIADQSGSSPIALVATTIVLSAIVITAYIYWGVKRGKISQIFSSGRSQGGARPYTKLESKTPQSSPKKSTVEDKLESDRYSGGLPFSWDPFSGFQSIRPVTTNVKFKDVAGLHASKQEVMEFVSYLKDPKKYQALGAKLPKGALLLGPPGTGKTLLVKALANEADVPFFSMAGSEFVEVIGGLGASRIRQLFRTARAKSPAIIFIDELDSLGRRRTAVDSGGRRGSPGGGGGGGVSEMEQTLNQLLVEMDGMDTAEGTIVFAATNRADLLDKALLRAGRFDRHIFIDLPNLAERKELLAMYLAKYRLSPTILQGELIQHLATWTPGMSGADIARLCNEAALVAARRDSPLEGVLRDDFEVAFERILAGAAKRSNPLSLPERRVAAVQEAGRALVAWLLPRTGLLPVKVSIVPRTMAGLEGSGGLGFTHLVPEERQLFNSEELKDRMAVMLGGRAAEQVIFNAISDASQRYLRKANELAFKQVREWGMSTAVGHLSFENDPSGNEFTMKPYSQRTQMLIELEAQQLVISAFTRCVELLQANKDKLQRLIDALLQKEVLNYDELVKLCQDQSSSSDVPGSTDTASRP
ncbi:ATP-dependent metallopeptidase HflB [Paragonimus heterotremus]|uniref:ATP-dependent metallopeptidase HflB n=1 Tax=Paragonimus heterotremus TaxID=100268 RepID=A0A8J4SQ92_9TREM|nr:ATP-dependent metallopeptidase HflB [Paragonimus heterotremus]